MAKVDQAKRTRTARRVGAETTASQAPSRNSPRMAPASPKKATAETQRPAAKKATGAHHQARSPEKRQTRAEAAVAAHRQALTAVGEFIRAQRQLGQLSLRELAERARVSNPYLSQLERGMYQPSAPVLRSIARALGVNPGTMFTIAGFLDDESTEQKDPSIEQAISVDPRLSPEQKRALVTIYRSFLAETL